MSQYVVSVSDPAMPTLSLVLEPFELGERLRELLPLETRGLVEVRVRLLRHHPGKRCVVEIGLRTTKASWNWIGKVYASDRRDVYHLMEGVWRAGFGPDEEFSISRPIAYLEPLQLLLQERVEGRRATESFLSDDESERRAAAERSARWLARFHATAPRVGPGFVSDPLLSIERWFRRLASLGEPFANKARTLFERLAAVPSELRHGEIRAIHGDYSHHQVILARGRTLTVDWDDYAWADRSRDLARFMVGLQRLALRSLGSIRALDSAAEVFLKTYVAQGHFNLASHLMFERAAVCLEHAKHDVHKQAPGWREKADTILDEGLRVLEQGA